MQAEKLDWADEYKLLLIWYFLDEHLREKKQTSKYGKDFFEPNFYLFEDYGIFERRDICFIMNRLTRNGLIQEVYFEYDEYENSKGAPVVKETFHTDYKKINVIDKNNPFGRTIAPFAGVKGSFLLNYSIRIDQEKCENFISSYLLRWSADRQAQKKRSNMKSTKQLQLLLKQISLMLKDCAPMNMILERPKNCDYDFVAAVFYLEKVGGLKVNHINFDPSFEDKFALRVDVLDSFYGLFPSGKIETKRMMELLLDPSTVHRRIVFSPPKTFACDGKEYEMRTGAALQLIQLVKDEGRVAEARFKQVLDGKNITNDLEDIYERLRSMLRKKFKFPSEERFFKVEEGMIIFSDLFDFHSVKKDLKGV